MACNVGAIVHFRSNPARECIVHASLLARVRVRVHVWYLEAGGIEASSNSDVHVTKYVKAADESIWAYA